MDLPALISQLSQLRISPPYIFGGRESSGVHLLGHVGESQTLHAVDVSRIRRQISQQQVQQAGFAAAVSADQRDALAGLDGHVAVAQEQFAAPAKRDVTQNDHVAGEFTRCVLMPPEYRPHRPRGGGGIRPGPVVRWRPLRTSRSPHGLELLAYGPLHHAVRESPL